MPGRVIGLLLGAYLLGSIPTAYLAGRWVRGVDVRAYGTHNVGGSNVWHTVGHWAVVPVGLFDIGKAAVPAWIALGPMHMGYPVAVAAGLCAALGHAWSVYLGFTGGRALSCILGTLLIVFPLGLLLESSLMVLGLALHAEALAAWLGLLSLPVASLALGEPTAVTLGCMGMALMTAVKRIEANRLPLPQGRERWQVVWRRLWLDRDIASHEEWVTYSPDHGRPGGGESETR